MNEEKIDLILKGINLLILNSEINQDIKQDFNLEFFDIFNPKTKPTLAERTHDALSESREVKE